MRPVQAIGEWFESLTVYQQGHIARRILTYLPIPNPYNGTSWQCIDEFREVIQSYSNEIIFKDLGFGLSLMSIIDYCVHTYDDMDSFLDFINRVKSHDSEKVTQEDFDNRKAIKDSWTEFRHSVLNIEKLSRIYIPL